MQKLSVLKNRSFSSQLRENGSLLIEKSKPLNLHFKIKSYICKCLNI